MTKKHLQEGYAEHYAKVSDDLQRENDLTLARTLAEDVLKDEELVTEVRQRVESSRLMVTAYGDTMATHDYVTQTLGFLSEVLRERHSA